MSTLARRDAKSPPRLRRHRRGQNYLCAAQAAAVLTGLLTTSIWSGGWSIDPAIALAIAGWAIHEGNTAWRGDACGC